MSTSYKRTYDKAALPDTGEKRLHIICIDGTWNDETVLSPRDGLTNVFKLYSMMEADSPAQIARYHRGAGNAEDEGVLRHLWNGATGDDGLHIANEAYARMVQDWRPGDILLIFGFSRGAALARHLANKIAKEGVPSRITITREAMANHVTAMIEAHISKVETDGPVIATPRIAFLGLWDTVASFGIPGNPINIGYHLDIPDRVERTFHLMAVDETRDAFEPTLIQSGVANAEEVWFPGAHADVGGGYPKGEDELSRITLGAMIRDASASLLRSGLPDLRLDTASRDAWVIADPAAGYVFHCHGLGLAKSPRRIHRLIDDAPPLIASAVFDLQQASKPLYALPEDAARPIPFSHYAPVNLSSLDHRFTRVP